MTIQVSVTIWTVLCFLALMLILDRMLFRPLLSFMDKRKEKITGARLSKETARREREEEIARRKQEHISAEKQAMQEASAALEKAREENARRLAEKKADNEKRLASEREALAEESRRILESAEPHTQELIVAFSSRLMSWRAGNDTQINK